MKSISGRLVLTALTTIILGGAPAAVADVINPAAPAPAQASGIVAFFYAGTIVSSTLPGVTPGERFTGTFSYDTSIPPNGGIGPGFANFNYSGTNFYHTITVSAGSFSDFSISTVFPFPSGNDYYTIDTTNSGLGRPSTLTLSASTIQKPQPGALTLFFYDPTGQSFAGSHPPSSYNLAVYTQALLSYDPPAGSFTGVITEIDPLGPAGVPEPSSLILAGLAVVTFVGVRRLSRAKAARPAVS